MGLLSKCNNEVGLARWLCVQETLEARESGVKRLEIVGVQVDARLDFLDGDPASEYRAIFVAERIRIVKVAERFLKQTHAR